MSNKYEINISKKVFNPVFLPYLEDDSRLLIFYGGAGSGKSVFVVQRYVYKMLKNDLCNILTLRKTGDTNRTSTFALFQQIINQWNLSHIFKVNKSDMTITCTLNDNQVIFKGLDNVEKLKSITFVRGELTDVWLEEASEDDENDYKQVNIRLRGGKSKKQIVMSLNPIDINHWIKKTLIDTNKATYLHTTYHDNHFIDEEYKAELESYKETDIYYYNVYCLGMWGVLGDSVFDVKVVNEQIAKNTQPEMRGYFIYDYNGVKITNIRFVEDTKGYVSIYKKAVRNVPYVLGGDTAGDGSDSFTAHVIDNRTGEQVAAFKNTFDEDLYARQVYCLGQYYNQALIGIETNYSTYPTKELERLGYKNLYVRMREDTYSHKMVKAFGFATTPTTRPVILANLIKIVREEGYKIVDVPTLEEMLSFVRNEKGRMEAAQGSHDDLVMGLAITYNIREQQSYSLKGKFKPAKQHYNFAFEDPENNKDTDSDIGSEVNII